MKKQIFFSSLLFFCCSNAMPQPILLIDAGGVSMFTTLLTFSIVVGGVVLWFKALMRAIKYSKDPNFSTTAIIAVILLIAIPPIGVIVSFSALRK